MKYIVMVVLALLSIFVIQSFIGHAKAETLILTTFEGEYAPFESRLSNLKDRSADYKICPKVVEGKIGKRPVVVAITGSGKVSSAACTLELLQKGNNQFREIILSGIAGASPFAGNQPVMLGDVCINSHAVDFAAQYYSADWENTKATFPVYWDFDVPTISKETAGSTRLADKLYDASKEISWETPSEEIANLNKLYGGSERKNKAWSASDCIEASDDLFWHDVNADRRARELGADWLNQALNYNTSANEIFVVTAMESSPVGAIIQRWNLSSKTPVDFAYVRGVSNFDQPAKNTDGSPKESGKASVERREADDGSAIAAKNAASVVLQMLEIQNK